MVRRFRLRRKTRRGGPGLHDQVRQGASYGHLLRGFLARSARVRDVGQEIAVGHVIGLIEAMKLFNEIKSDMAGRVVRVVAETGKLVKAKQPLIEVEP